MPKIAFLIAAVLIAFIAVKAATHQILHQSMESGTEVIEGHNELPRLVVEDLLDTGDEVLRQHWVSEEFRKQHDQRVEKLFAGRREDPPRWKEVEGIVDGERVWGFEKIYENNPSKRGWADGIAAFVFFDDEASEYWYVTSGGIGGWTYYTGPISANELD
jgi:hypothetical protein